MARLEGIIYSAFGNYIVLRGFAPIMSLTRISKKKPLLIVNVLMKLNKLHIMM